MKLSVEEETNKRVKHQADMDHLQAELTFMKTEQKQLHSENQMMLDEKNSANAALMKLKRFVLILFVHS